ncbi:MAG: hypothetical protein R3245_04060 [Kiloniellales bacterium]|nr:hypothetical protein [Kiloniellales bacterium]
MRIKLLILALAFACISQPVWAQLEPFTDFDTSKELWNITLVKVDSNMTEDYLEGLKETWVASNKVAMELGQIEDFHIYRSQLENSGDVNLFLVTKFTDSSQLEPNKEEYAKFMEAWGHANQERTREITKNYPSMREITGEYLVREITIK